MKLSQLTIGLALLTTFAAPAAFAEGDGKDKAPRPKLQDSGLDDDDDDLLDPDLDDEPEQRTPETVPAQQAVEIPPAAEQARIDAEAEAIGQAANQVSDELAELEKLMAADAAAGKAEMERRIAASEVRLSSLRAKIDALDAAVSAKDRDARRRDRSYGTYGSPLDGRSIYRNRNRINRARGRPIRNGRQQFSWWQRLLLKALDGIRSGQQRLAERRANELKARSDALAMSTDPRYRGYANSRVRDTVGNSRFGNPRDRRLNDLLLPGNTTSRTAPVYRAPIAVTSNTNNNYSNQPVVLLPRVRDPLTGRVHVVVNQPLGGPVPAYYAQPAR